MEREKRPLERPPARLRRRIGRHDENDPPVRAGAQHAYLDAAGNLCPCDFVPLAFGNVREKPLRELWEEMHGALGRPRCGCLAMELWRKKLLADRPALPVPPEGSRAIAAALPKDGPLPGFYRALLGR
ncbi:MAG: SPASM domain-containing protein [Kiritimatiellae bacterium]|nr:SPASM domain-containing protein [Kiritimatiellia bacterium]